MAIMGRSQLSCIMCVFFVEVIVGSLCPKYVWPLGDSSVYREVMVGQDGHLPASSQCFVFSDGYPGLPYRALTLTGQDDSFVDFYLNGKEELTDLAISLYIYPSEEPAGTILNYMCETGNVIKLAVLQRLLFVSFWDEFGVSVGATAIPELLVAETWSHLLVSREFESGRIKVFHNGEEVDNIDDDFPNKIHLPNKGSIRLGSTQKDKNDRQFKGRFACFQFYTQTPTAEEVKSSTDYCMPDKWNIIPKVNLKTQVTDGEEKQCVTDYVVPSDDDTAPKECGIIDMSCVSSGLNWNSVLRKNQWTTSTRDTAHFHLIGRDHIPAQNEDTMLGSIITRDKMICSRLCLRVNGCKAFSSMFHSFNTTQCVLYKNVGAEYKFEEGAVLYSLT